MIAHSKTVSTSFINITFQNSSKANFQLLNFHTKYKFSPLQVSLKRAVI